MSQEFLNPVKPHFGKVPDSNSIHGEEQEFFANEQAMASDDSRVLEKDADSQEFFEMKTQNTKTLLQMVGCPVKPHSRSTSSRWNQRKEGLIHNAVLKAVNRITLR